MPVWMQSRRFLGTVVLVIAYTIQANVSGFVIPDLAIQVWMTWMGAETITDTVRTLRQQPPPAPPASAPEATPEPPG